MGRCKGLKLSLMSGRLICWRVRWTTKSNQGSGTEHIDERCTDYVSRKFQLSCVQLDRSPLAFAISCLHARSHATSYASTKASCARAHAP